MFAVNNNTKRCLHKNVEITKEFIGTEAIALNLSRYLKANNLKIPLLVFGKNVYSFTNIVEIESAHYWKKFIVTAGSLLGTDVNIAPIIAPEYVAVDVNYFLNITTTCMGCDVYIKVKRGENDFQFIKMLHSTDGFTRKDIAKYMATGLREFYTAKDHYSDFVNYVTTQLSLKLEGKNITGVDRIQLNSESFEVTLDRISNLDIDSFTIGLVDESIKSMQSSIKESSALGYFLAQLSANKLSYAYSHSYLTCLILHKIISPSKNSKAS